MRTVHELASDLAAAKLKSVRDDLQKMTAANRRQWLQKRWASKLGDIEPNASPEVSQYWKKPWENATVEGLTLQVEPGILVPVLLLHPSAAGARRAPVVVAIAEGGKERFSTTAPLKSSRCSTPASMSVCPTSAAQGRLHRHAPRSFQSGNFACRDRIDARQYSSRRSAEGSSNGNRVPEDSAGFR